MERGLCDGWMGRAGVLLAEEVGSDLGPPLASTQLRAGQRVPASFPGGQLNSCLLPEDLLGPTDGDVEEA